MVEHATFADFRLLSQAQKSVPSSEIKWDLRKDGPAESLMDLFNNLKEIPVLQTCGSEGARIDFNTPPALEAEQKK